MVKGHREPVSDRELSSEDNGRHNNATLTFNHLFVHFAALSRALPGIPGSLFIYLFIIDVIVDVSWLKILD